MGSLLFRDSRLRGDRIDMNGKLVKAPACLDELLDWTISANALIKEMGDSVRMTFRPYVKISSFDHENQNLQSVCEKDVSDFPGTASDLSLFYISKVVVVAEPVYRAPINGNCLKSTLSVADFCTYYELLRRYSELMDIGTSSTLAVSSTGLECGICMAKGEDVVLPCMHSLCSSCAKKWVTSHGDCPFCRKKYPDHAELNKNQWQLQEWSQNSLENDTCNLETKIKSFWLKHGSYKSISPDQWKPLKSSVSSSVIVPIDCILLQ